MKRKELTKTFMMILFKKPTLISVVYAKIFRPYNGYGLRLKCSGQSHWTV